MRCAIWLVPILPGYFPGKSGIPGGDMNTMKHDPLHVFDWAPVGLLHFEADADDLEKPETWVCRVANSEACNLLGRLPLDGLSLGDLFPPNVANSLSDAVITNPVTNKVDFFISEPGTWLLASGNRVARSLTVALTDITREKQAAFADHRLMNLYKSLSSSLADNEIILFDKDFNIILTEGTPRFIRMNGNGQADYIGKSVNSLFDQTDFSFLGQIVARAFGQDGRQEIEQEVNGAFYKASVSCNVQSEEPGHPNLVGILLIKDVTELNKKQQELEQRLQQLDRSNKELEQFAYVASHDLQEPLRKIISFGKLLNQKYGASLAGTGQMYLERMSEAAKRMERLIDDLLSFSRTTRKDRPFEPTDLRQMLDEVLNDLNTAEDGDIFIQIPDNLPVIQAIPSQMRQLFQNILNNAVKFTLPGIPPVVQIRCRSVSAAELPQWKLLPDKRYCLLEFEDNGIGFEQENAERIFTIFQRLHGRSEYSGSGVGLAICKKIVDNHNGVIYATGESGIGAVFSVVLPLEQ